MSLEIFKAGKATEKEALGVIDKKKEEDLSLQFISDRIIKKRFGDTDPEVVERFLDTHPEVKEEIDKETEKFFYLKFKSKDYSFVYSEGKALEIAKEAQPKERAELADDLYNIVGENLGLEDRDDEDDLIDLKYYTAVGSKLDISFGVDCFFVYDHLDKKSGEKKEIMVSIDVTINPNKTVHKTDMLLRFNEDSAEKRDNWRDLVKKYGKEISDKFIEKIGQINQTENN